MSGLIQILLKPKTKISIFIKVHIPSNIVCIQLQVQFNVFEKNQFSPHVKLLRAYFK